MLASKLMGAGGAGGPVGPTAFSHIFSTGFGSGYFTSVDVTTPGSLTQVDFLSSLGGMRQFDVDRVGQVAYVGSATNLLRSIDVSDPTNMAVLDSINYGGDMRSGLAFDSVREVVFANNRGSNLLYAIDVSNPSSMSTISNLSITYDSVFAAYDEVNQYLFLTYQLNYLDVYDVSNTSSMSFRGSTIISGSGFQEIALDTANQVAFVADYTGTRFYALDYSTANPTQISSLSLASGGRPVGCRLDLANQVAYLGCLDDSIRSIDISNTSSMSVLDTYTSATEIDDPYALELDLVNQILFVGAYSGNEVSSFDVSDPTNITFLDNLTTTETGQSIYLRGI